MSFDSLQSSRFLILTMKCLGLWHFDNEWQPIYRACSLIFHGIFTFLFIFAMYINFGFIKGIDNLTESLYMALTETALLVKITNMLIYAPDAVRFINATQNKLLRITDEEEIKIFLDTQKTFSFLRIIYNFACLGFCLFAFIIPLTSTEWITPFSIWIPFEWRSWDTYWYVYFYQVICMLETCLSNVTMDFFQAFLFMQIGSYYKLIAYRLEHIGFDRADEKVKNEEIVIKELKNIIETRQYVDRMAKLSERITSFPVLIQTFLTALVLCFTGYKLKDMSPLERTGPFIQFVDYAMVMTLQIFIPCYYGNEITLNSNCLTNAIYNSNWINLSMKTKRIIFIYMEYLKKPIVLRAGKLFAIGLGTFTKTINNAYSLFALLLNMTK